MLDSDTRIASYLQALQTIEICSIFATFSCSTVVNHLVWASSQWTREMTIKFHYCNTSLQLFLLLMRSLCCAKFASKQRLTWRVTLGQLIVWSWEAVIVSSISAISGDQVKVDSSAGVCSTSLVTRHAGGEWKHWTCCITRHMDSDILRISVW